MQHTQLCQYQEAQSLQFQCSMCNLNKWLLNAQIVSSSPIQRRKPQANQASSVLASDQKGEVTTLPLTIFRQHRPKDHLQIFDHPPIGQLPALVR